MSCCTYIIRSRSSGDEKKLLLEWTGTALGYSCSYQPSLKLLHYLKADRINWLYLLRLIYGNGRSFAMLQEVLGMPETTLKLKRGLAEAAKRLLRRLWHEGVEGLVNWAWDLGYLRHLTKVV